MLDALAAAPQGRSSFALARQLGLSNSTTAAILTALHDSAYVERQPDKTYRLGRGLLRILGGLREQHPLLGFADEEVGRLAEQAGVGANFTRITPDDLEVLLCFGATSDLDNHPGHRLPMEPPHGALAMAWRSPEEIEEWLETAPHALSTEQASAQRDTLEDIRHLGYAVYRLQNDPHAVIERIRELLGTVPPDASVAEVRSKLGHFASIVGTDAYSAAQLAIRQRRGVSYVIAPVFGPDGQPRYIVSLHVMRESVPQDELDRYVAELTRCTHALTAYVGGRVPTAARSVAAV